MSMRFWLFSVGCDRLLLADFCLSQLSEIDPERTDTNAIRKPAYVLLDKADGQPGIGSDVQTKGLPGHSNG